MTIGTSMVIKIFADGTKNSVGRLLIDNIKSIMLAITEAAMTELLIISIDAAL